MNGSTRASSVGFFMTSGMVYKSWLSVVYRRLYKNIFYSYYSMYFLHQLPCPHHVTYRYLFTNIGLFMPSPLSFKGVLILILVILCSCMYFIV